MSWHARDVPVLRCAQHRWYATCLIDWAVWCASLARNNEYFDELITPLYRYADETPTRVPLSDWFFTNDGRRRGFQARSVVGGMFMRLFAQADPSAPRVPRLPNGTVLLPVASKRPVYLNGQKILAVSGYTTGYELVDATAGVAKALRKGVNTLAVTCHQTTGGQSMDVGLVLDPIEFVGRPARPSIKPLFDHPVRYTCICVRHNRSWE